MKYSLKYIIILPVIVSLVLTSFLLYGLFVTDSPYKNKIIPFACFVLFLWVLVAIKFLRTQIKIFNYDMKKKHILLIYTFFFIISIVIAFYFSFTIWGMDCLSLSPIARINNGIQHKDTLYHSTIAESYRRSYPSALINDETYLHYHTFSHLLMSIFARLLSIPAFIAYNYIFPIVFLPIYLFAQIIAVFSAKKVFSCDSIELNISDLLVIAFYNVGFLFHSVLGKYAVWKYDYIASESYLIGNTLAFIFYAILLLNIKTEHKKAYRYFLFIVGIPVMIFFVSWAKISIGMLFTVSILYYFFRMKMKSIKYWILNIFYGLSFLICLKLFNNGAGFQPNIKKQFRLFAINDYCTGTLGVAGHYLLLSILGILFIIFEIKYHRYGFTDIKNKKTIWIEEIIIISLCAFLPSALLVINGGSAVYFSYFVETPAMVMLCGKGYISKIINRIRKGRFLFFIMITLWYVIIGSNACITILHKENLIVDDRETGFYNELMNIREMAADSPELYTFYLEPDAKSEELFFYDISKLYVYPALTGIGVINASYYYNGKYYIFTGKDVGGAYGLKSFHNGKLSFNEALDKAREMGKERIIHVTKEGYEIVECN